MAAAPDHGSPPTPRLADVADMRPCSRCGRTDRRRMVALMTLWFGRFAELPVDHGYFYLCPACYARFIAPHFAPVVQQLTAAQRDDADAV
jgi:hypothetical protein